MRGIITIYTAEMEDDYERSGDLVVKEDQEKSLSELIEVIEDYE